MRSLHRLSVKAVASLEKPGVYADGGGLYVRVAKGGSKSWIAIYHLNGKRKEMGLGGSNGVSLARARQKAAGIRELVADGIDPILARRRPLNMPTFGMLADDWIAINSNAVRSEKSIARWKRTIGDGGYCKGLRNKQVDQISPEDVLAVLQPIWVSKNPTARYLRSYIEAVLGLAIAQSLRTADSATLLKRRLDHGLAKMKRSAESHSAVAWPTMPAFMALLRARPSNAARCLEFLILTAARTSEALNATWHEVDLDRRTWTVPASRMKMGKEHVVPLSDAAIELLSQVIPAAGRAGLIFKGPREGEPLSNMAMAMLLRRMGRSETVHGFRSSFRDYAGDETEHPREIAEMALAHAVGDNAEQSYRRGTALERRRRLMEDWATFLARKTGEAEASPSISIE